MVFYSSAQAGEPDTPAVAMRLRDGCDRRVMAENLWERGKFRPEWGKIGAWAVSSGVEHLTFNQGVRGSNPRRLTSFKKPLAAPDS